MQLVKETQGVFRISTTRSREPPYYVIVELNQDSQSSRTLSEAHLRAVFDTTIDAINSTICSIQERKLALNGVSRQTLTNDHRLKELERQHSTLVFYEKEAAAHSTHPEDTLADELATWLTQQPHHEVHTTKLVPFYAAFPLAKDRKDACGKTWKKLCEDHPTVLAMTGPSTIRRARVSGAQRKRPAAVCASQPGATCNITLVATSEASLQPVLDHIESQQRQKVRVAVKLVEPHNLLVASAQFLAIVAKELKQKNVQIMGQIALSDEAGGAADTGVQLHVLGTTTDTAKVPTLLQDWATNGLAVSPCVVFNNASVAQKDYLKAFRNRLYDGTKGFSVTLCLKEGTGSLHAWVVCLCTCAERMRAEHTELEMIQGQWKTGTFPLTAHDQLMQAEYAQTGKLAALKDQHQLQALEFVAGPSNTAQLILEGLAGSVDAAMQVLKDAQNGYTPVDRELCFPDRSWIVLRPRLLLIKDNIMAKWAGKVNKLGHIHMPVNDHTNPLKFCKMSWSNDHIAEVAADVEYEVSQLARGLTTATYELAPAEMAFVQGGDFDVDNFEKQHNATCELPGAVHAQAQAAVGGGAADKAPVCVGEARVILGANTTKTLRVCVGDITKSHSDVIVNAANERLDHAAGVARAIAVQAGSQMQAACQGQHVPVGSALATTSGDLAKTTPIKHVIHAVAPRYDSLRVPAMLSQMREAVNNSLAQASHVRATAVAFPAIGTGVFGWPTRTGVECITQSAILWLKQNPNTSVQEVCFTDFDQAKVGAFQAALKKISAAARTAAPQIVTAQTSLHQWFWKDDKAAAATVVVGVTTLGPGVSYDFDQNTQVENKYQEFLTGQASATTFTITGDRAGVKVTDAAKEVGQAYAKYKVLLHASPTQCRQKNHRERVTRGL